MKNSIFSNIILILKSESCYNNARELNVIIKSLVFTLHTLPVSPVINIGINKNISFLGMIYIFLLFLVIIGLRSCARIVPAL